MIVDWYFTRCIGANPKQAMTFLRILECFDSSDGDVRTAAIEQLTRVDDWMQLYALPRVLAVAVDIPSQAALDAYYASVTEGRESATRLLDLIDAASRATAKVCVNTFANFAEGQRREAAGRSKLPYIDLREFADESIALAAFRAAVTRQPEIRNEFKSAGNDASALILNSLTHDLGRMAFVEGVRLAHMLGLRSRDVLLHLLERHSDLVTEPDLAATYVWLRFCDAEDAAPDVVLALLRESVLLNDYRRLSAASNKSADMPAFPALRLIANSAMYRVVLWQLVLWSAAAEIDPKTAASAFAAFWIPPQQRDARFEIGHPAENRKIQPWIKDFVQPLIAQRGYTNLIVRTARDASFVPKAEWWPLTSPWLLIDTARQRRAYPRTRYLRATPLNALRLLGVTAIATRLLLRRQVAEEAVEALAALAVHAYDVLEVFVFGDSTDDEGSKIQMHGDLEVLARFIHRQLSVLASGEAGVDPDVFVSLLGNEKSSDDEQIFRNEVLPAVLVSFVSDAIPLATQGSGAVKWMEQLTVCYPYMKRAQARDRIAAQLLVRYLTRIDEDLEDWRRIADGVQKSYWNINAQRLLLPRECVAVDWWAPDWPEPDADHAAVVPVRLVQRFAAAFSNDGAVPGAVTAAWRQEFLDAIASTTSRPDDFLRLRLNEILFDPAIDASPEERTAIFSLLVDWASPSDVERLANALFPPSSPVPRDSELRSLFVGIAIHDVEVLGAASTDATDPRFVLRSRKRSGTFRTALRRAAFCAHADSTYASLQGPLKTIAKRSDARRTPRFHRGTFELVNEREIEMPSPMPGIARQIRSISRDPNRMTATVLYEEFDFDPALVTDLLHAKPGTAETTAGVPQGEALGVIIDHDDKHLVIDCGLNSFVQARPGPKVHVGSVVQVQLEQRGNAWSAKQVVPLVPRHEMSPATWKLRWPKAGLPEVVHERTILTTTPSRAGYIDWNYWLPDIQIVFTRQGAFEAVVLAERLDSGEWRPVTRDVWRLISSYGPNVEAAVVSFDDEQLVVSPAPGSLFSIALSDLQESARQRIRGLQVHFTDIRGLRLPLRAEVDAGGHVTVALDDSACDDVNVRWRQLFDGMDALTARREAGSVYLHAIEEPIPGFPVNIQVSFEPPQKDTEVDFVVDSPSAWDPWRNKVRGTRTHFSEIEAKPFDRPRVVQELLNVKHADRFKITKARGRVSDRGELLCLTNENLPFDVKAETLSFGSVAGSIRGEREVEVTQIAQFSKLKFPGDDTDVPREILDAGGGEGIIARAPRPKEPAKTYEIWWLAGSRVIERELTIEGQPQYLGTRVTAAAISDGVEITVHPRRIKCDALWRQVAPDLSDGSLYLGVVGGKAAIEQLPGVFQLVSQSAARGKHLARWSNAAFIGGLTGRERATVQQLGAQNRKRAMVALSERGTDDVIWGDTFASGDLVSDVRLSITKANAAERYILKRTFALTRREVEVVVKRDDSAIYQKQLDEYFENVHTLDVTVRPPATVLLSNPPVPDGTTGKWKRTVNFGRDEGAWVGSARYRGNGARVQLIRERDGNIVASARAVPPLSLADYYDLLEVDPKEEIALDQPLYYAGAAEGDGFHRFEWGYGWTIVVHESELRFLNYEFRAARDLIFFGDAVRRISFEVELPQDDENAAPRYTLVLNDLSIDYSEATLIFMQRRKHKIVHLLRLKPKRIGGNVAGAEIASVVGLDVKSADMAHGFERTRGVLAAASEAIVIARLKSTEESESWKEPSIYGRFDETEFRRSLGKEVRFDLVELTLSATRRNRLRSRELVFLMAGEGSRRRNDYGLAMRVPDGIHADDVGGDAKDMLVLRRGFSVREEVLPRLMRRDPSSLDGQLFLVRPSQFNKSMRLSLWWRKKDTDEEKAAPLPTRKGEVLQSLVQHSFVLATVINAAHHAIDVEYSPGIFIEIKTDQIEFASADLLKELGEGSVIRIEKGTSTPYLVSRAAFSDGRYLSEGLRTVVAFPKNELFDRKKSEPWQIENASWNTLRFPLGGMPDVLAVPGSLNVLTKAWGEPDTAQFREFMSRVHPKIALAGPGDKGSVRFEPGRTKAYVGAIAVDPVTREPRYQPDPAVGAPWTHGNLKWPFLSFADASVRTIQARLEREWRYHDDVTCVWREDGDIDSTPLPSHNGITGPVMFDQGGGDLHLRYAANALSRFGYPMRELVNYLGDRGDSAWFAVAAITPSSMWIEIAPGRVSELPFAQIVHADVPAASLRSLEWSLFAPGDWVQLRLASTDPKTPDRVAIQQWVPSLRGAAGERMILPVVAHDAEEGVLRLGAGDFETDYPWLDKTVPPVVLLALGNRASRFQIRDITRKDCALLALDARGELCIAGCAGLTVQPSNAGWEGDPLSVWFKRVGAEELVRIAGGAIPVTIEDIEGTRIYFSRAWQKGGSVLGAERMTVARVLGALDGNRMLLRSGSALFVGRADAVVSGLPHALSSAMAQTLHERNEKVWIRGSGSGDVTLFGLADERTATIRAKAVAVASDGTSLGLACRSHVTQSLYWLPANDVAWTRMTADELRDVFVERDFPFRAQLRPDAAGREVLSITRTPDAIAELRALHVDDELSVKVIQKRAGAGGTSQFYLVSTYGSGIVMVCRFDDAEQSGELKADTDLRVEVIRRFIAHPPVVSVTKVGTRRPELDVPAWMLVEAATSAIPAMMRRTVEWINADRVTPRRNLGSAPDAMIDQAVAEAWGCLTSGNLDLKLGLGIAEAWYLASGNREEIELAHALMCIVLLRRLSAAYSVQQADLRAKQKEKQVNVADAFVRDWNEFAGDLLAQIAARALRSLHSEVLSKRWLKTNLIDEPARLLLLRSSFQQPVTTASLSAIRQYCRSSELRDWSSKNLPRVVADGCRRAIGEAEIYDHFHSEAQLLERVIRLGDAYTAPLRPNRKLHLAYFEEIESLLGQIIANRISVSLMRPIEIREAKIPSG